MVILKKELNMFFSSLTAYIVIGVFLITIGLFIWVIPDTNVMDYGFASLETFFSFVPTVLLFLIPAITMRLFAEETQQGTIELLATKPITDIQIVSGKYLAALALILFALIPTLLYFFSIYRLGAPVGNIDIGATAGSYIGLFLIAAAFAAIGVFTSSISSNQIVAFVLGTFVCFFFFLGFEFISALPIFFGKAETIISAIGMNAHFTALGRGLIDTRDVIYFASVIVFFLVLTLVNLSKRKW